VAWSGWRFARRPDREPHLLAALLNPDIVEKVIDGYWRKNGEERDRHHRPRLEAATHAREMGCLDQAALERLEEISAAWKRSPRGTDAEKLAINSTGIDRRLWSEVVSLPHVLIRGSPPGSRPD